MYIARLIIKIFLLTRPIYQARQLVYFGVMITDKQTYFSKSIPIYTRYIQNKPFHNGQTAFPQWCLPHIWHPLHQKVSYINISISLL